MPDSRPATVRILREAACPGARSIHVQINGIDVGRLLKGRSISVQLVPGNHQLYFRYGPMASVKGEGGGMLPVAAGDDVDLIVRSRPGFFKHAIEFRRQRWHDQMVPASNFARNSNEPALMNFSITTGGLTEEEFGEQTVVVDHSNSVVSSAATIRAEKGCSRSISFSTSDTVTRGIAVRLGTNWAAIEGRLERAVENRFEIRHDEHQGVSEQVTVTVPAFTEARFTIRWKRVWQEGVIHISGPRGHIADVPFRYISHLAFDLVST